MTAQADNGGGGGKGRAPRVLPPSRRTRHRLLVALLERADGGDVAATEAIIRLGSEADAMKAVKRRADGGQ